MVAMKDVLPVLSLIAGFLLAWLFLRRRSRETDATFKAMAADALARNNQSFLDLRRS